MGFNKTRGVIAINDIVSKGIYKGDNGDVVKTGSKISVYFYNLNKIVELNQKESACVISYDGRTL